MLKARILSTIRFFDLQEIPLTLLEIHRFLISEMEVLKFSQDDKWEWQSTPDGLDHRQTVSLAELLACLRDECKNEVVYVLGFYCFMGREDLCIRRWKNYAFAVFRERRISKFIPALKHFPFVRSVALGGSQALGQPKKFSDIDLFIVVKPGFLWLVRTMVSLYFQILGLRRHGKNVANRFCLNHYVAEQKVVDRERNLYKAMEYVRLRPLIYPQGLVEFLQVNAEWIKVFLPNWQSDWGMDKPSLAQRFLERCLKNILGRGLNNFLGFWQKLKIKQDEFTFVLPDELSFHPHSQHRELLNRFFSE